MKLRLLVAVALVGAFLLTCTSCNKEGKTWYGGSKAPSTKVVAPPATTTEVTTVTSPATPAAPASEVTKVTTTTPAITPAEIEKVVEPLLGQKVDKLSADLQKLLDQKVGEEVGKKVDPLLKERIDQALVEMKPRSEASATAAAQSATSADLDSRAAANHAAIAAEWARETREARKEIAAAATAAAIAAKTKAGDVMKWLIATLVITISTAVFCLWQVTRMRDARGEFAAFVSEQKREIKNRVAMGIPTPPTQADIAQVAAQHAQEKAAEAAAAEKAA